MDLLEQIEQKADEVEKNTSNTTDSANRAENAAQNVETTIDWMKQEVVQEVNASMDTRLDERLVDYYTKPEVDNITDNIMPDEIYGGTSELDKLMDLNNGNT